MDMVLFGRQGCGKGTQGAYFAERYDMIKFVTGDELRKLAEEDSELGQRVKSIIDAGKLVSNEIVMEIIENFMKKTPPEKGIIFDGIPRKLIQAETFDALMKKLGREFKGIVLEIGEDTAIKRLSTRRMCSNDECKAIYPANYELDKCDKCGSPLETRTDDQNMDSIRTRLEAYKEETVPVIERYKEMGKVIELDGEPPIDEVNALAFPILDPIFKK